MDYGTLGLIFLPVFAMALIGGGIVLYRQSAQVVWRAIGMGAVASGIMMLLVFSMVLPVSRSSESPEPVVSSIEVGGNDG